MINEQVVIIARKIRQKYTWGGFRALSDAELQRLAAIEPTKFDDVSAEYIRRKAERGEYNTLKKVLRSKDAYDVLQPFYEGLDVEHFYAAYLNRANKVIGVRLIGIGGISGTVCDVRVLLKYAIELGASGIILSHNHPSGNTQPSEADRVLTRRIKEAANIMDMQLIEHIIIAGGSYLSFADEGLI